jgi:hypothetical protein
MQQTTALFDVGDDFREYFLVVKRPDAHVHQKHFIPKHS